MGMVAMTYKLNPNSEVEDINAESIAEAVKSLASDSYDIQAVDVKPLAFESGRFEKISLMNEKTPVYVAGFERGVLPMGD